MSGPLVGWVVEVRFQDRVERPWNALRVVVPPDAIPKAGQGVSDAAVGRDADLVRDYLERELVGVKVATVTPMRAGDCTLDEARAFFLSRARRALGTT